MALIEAVTGPVVYSQCDRRGRGTGGRHGRSGSSQSDRRGCEAAGWRTGSEENREPVERPADSS